MYISKVATVNCFAFFVNASLSFQFYCHGFFLEDSSPNPELLSSFHLHHLILPNLSARRKYLVEFWKKVLLAAMSQLLGVDVYEHSIGKAQRRYSDADNTRRQYQLHQHWRLVSVGER